MIDNQSQQSSNPWSVSHGITVYTCQPYLFIGSQLLCCYLRCHSSATLCFCQ